jgi:hypothetical protein
MEREYEITANLCLFKITSSSGDQEQATVCWGSPHAILRFQAVTSPLTFHCSGRYNKQRAVKSRRFSGKTLEVLSQCQATLRSRKSLQSIYRYFQTQRRNSESINLERDSYLSCNTTLPLFHARSPNFGHNYFQKLLPTL